MKQKIYVWDPIVRLFHWTLVAAFTIAYFTGDEESLVHIYAGYVVLALIAVRLVWGFVGSRHARFTDFIRSPRLAFEYLVGLITGSVKNYVGHSPAAGWMVIALLVSLFLTSVTGLQVYGLEGHGPLAQQAVVETRAGPTGPGYAWITQADAREDEGMGGKEGDEGEDFWEEVHEVVANLTVFLIVLHLLGVALSSYRHRQNLVRAMVTGYKSEDESP